ncbi:hypothetical protein CPB86DRAFT_785757 [Serendipita vermifera]|nr:hypothetical protein CPB86DRAFT_785757 [Serendipita vermifera]
MTTLESLPLQIRLGIRDSFNSQDAPIQKALKSFNENIGYDFSVEIAWIDLWNDLQGKYTDKSAFVPSITDSVITFLKRLETLLDTSQDFQETFLEKIERMRKAIFVKIHDKSTPAIEVVRGELLTLFLPKNAAPDYRTISSQIGKDLEEAFRDKRTVERPQNISEDLKDDFVDISPTPTKPTFKSSSRVSSLPQASSLARPENLFSTLVPYTLIVHKTGSGIDIEGTHQPTLELIHEYFKRHSRKNLNDTRQIPYFIVDLIPSQWGSGIYHDVVRISREDSRATWVHATITPILAFIEGVCGYDLHSSDSEWIFRRNEPFV